MDKNLVARWVSRSGKHCVDLYSDRFGLTYSSTNCGGNLGNITVAEGIARMQTRVDRGDFVPDAAKTKMMRVL